MINLAVDLKWCKQKQILYYQNKQIPLSESETVLLNELIKNINSSVSSETLHHLIFDLKQEYSQRSIRNLVYNLRKKIPVHFIENIYGGKYIIRIESICESIKSDLNDYLFDILDQVSHGVVITDSNQDDNPTIYTNKNFLETFQLEAKDILGKNCRILQHHNTNQKNKVKLKEAIRNKKQITVELLNYKIDLTPH